MLLEYLRLCCHSFGVQVLAILSIMSKIAQSTKNSWRKRKHSVESKVAEKLSNKAQAYLEIKIMSMKHCSRKRSASDRECHKNDLLCELSQVWKVSSFQKKVILPSRTLLFRWDGVSRDYIHFQPHKKKKGWVLWIMLLKWERLMLSFLYVRISFSVLELQVL